MKKILRAVFFLSILAALFASCKTHERCPAYGKAVSPKASRTSVG